MQVIDVLNAFETRSFAKTDVQYFNSILLGVEVKWGIADIRHFVFNGPQKVWSIGFKAFFWMNIFKVVAFEMGDILEDSDGKLLQRIGTVFNACKIELP